MVSVNINQTLPGTCGASVLASFQPYSNGDSWTNPEQLTPVGGAGWAVAGFIRHKKGCKEAYEAFKARWPIVLQTPTRLNNNSGNSFIFVVYDTRKKRKSKNNPEGKVDLSRNSKYIWPWKV